MWTHAARRNKQLNFCHRNAFELANINSKNLLSNFFPNCEGWVQRGTIWTDFDLNCVTQHEKNYEFCLTVYFLLFAYITFCWWITCFDWASQYSPSLFFASHSWHPKSAASLSFEKAWQWLWGSFYWSCGKLRCIQSEYYIPVS